MRGNGKFGGVLSWCKAASYLALATGLFVAVDLYAAGGSSSGGGKGIGGIASNITGSFESVGKLMIGVAYLAGIGFAIAGIFKFKQHKDNPTQIPVGTPIALLIISVALVFLPSFFAPAGDTLFGGDSKAGGFTGGGVSALPGDGGSS